MIEVATWKIGGDGDGDGVMEDKDMDVVCSRLKESNIIVKAGV